MERGSKKIILLLLVILGFSKATVVWGGGEGTEKEITSKHLFLGKTHTRFVL